MAEPVNKNFYGLLGVLPSASMTELKRAYRDKARAFHPDLNPTEESQDQFRAIQEAYNLLRDPVERTFYDRGLGFKSNWVEESVRSSDRKKAQERMKRAQTATGVSPESEPSKPSEKNQKATGSAQKNRGAESTNTSGGQGGGPSAENEPSGTKQKTRGKAGERASFSGFSGRGKSGNRFTSSRSGINRNRDFSSRGTQQEEPRTPPNSKENNTEKQAPEEKKAPWYQDKALRIFLFGVNILAAIVLFFNAPERGIYFLELAFGIEILYRLKELKSK